MNGQQIFDRVYSSNTLEELRNQLNWLRENAGDGWDDYIDFSSLKTFGGEGPEDTSEIFSWDEENFLVQGESEWEITPREGK